MEFNQVCIGDSVKGAHGGGLLKSGGGAASDCGSDRHRLFCFLRLTCIHVALSYSCPYLYLNG
ncbi:unnamed protein product [Arabidopsis halleri]